MFKFVGGDGVGSAQKRQQAPKACEACRRRKKRCNHLPPGQKARRTRTHPLVNSDVSTLAPLPSPTATETTTGGDFDQQGPPKRHMLHGQPNEETPEDSTSFESPPDTHQYQDKTTADARESPSARRSNQAFLDTRFIGDSSPEGIFLAATCPDTNRDKSMNGSIGVWLNSFRSGGAPAAASTSPAQSPSDLFYGSSSMVQTVLAPLIEQECMSVLPSVSRVEALSNIYFEKVHPIFPVLDETRYHSLHGQDPELIILQQAICLAASKNFTARQYLFLKGYDQLLSCREFGDRLSAAMRLSIEMGLVKTKLVLIQVLSLMSLFSDGPDAGDMSSQLSAKAVHHVHSIGLHIESHQDSCWGQYGITLFCCIWALDRLNSALNGRPILIHERDIRQDFEQCIEQQEPCFRLFLHVVILLDKGIGLYRPSIKPAPDALDGTFPVFEELVAKMDCSQIGSTSLATIEVLYHAVSILSCRAPVWSEPPRSSKSYIRQILSTWILSSTVSKELRTQLVLFPFIPYALSLSLSIAYREMRYGKVPIFRVRARTQFQDIYDTISELDDVYRSASTTARRSKKLLAEMDRVVSTVTIPEQRRLLNATQPNVEYTMSEHDATNEWGARNNISGQTMPANEAEIQIQPFQDFDPAYFDVTGDVDLFGMFDPAFNLEDFDACLESNLNPYLPSYGP